MLNKVWIVLDESDGVMGNISTGTRVYMRKANAIRQASKYKGCRAVEFDLVPSGVEYNDKGEVTKHDH